MLFIYQKSPRKQQLIKQTRNALHLPKIKTTKKTAINQTNKKGSSFTKNTKKTAINQTNEIGSSFTKKKNTKKTVIYHTNKKCLFINQKHQENSN